MCPTHECFPPTGLFVHQNVILSKSFSSTIIFPLYSVFHLLRNITHYSIPTSPFKVSSPYWLFYFHCIFYFLYKPHFSRWLWPLKNIFFTTVFLIIHNFLLRNIVKIATVSAHMYFFLRSICPCTNIHFSSVFFHSNLLLPSWYCSSFGSYSTTDLRASTLTYGIADYFFSRVLRHHPIHNFYILITTFSFVILMKIDDVSA